MVLLKKTYVFPWSQFLYAEGTTEEVRMAFTTHDVLIKGALLGSLLDELTSQRVARLSEPARTENSLEDPQAGLPRCSSENQIRASSRNSVTELNRLFHYPSQLPNS